MQPLLLPRQWRSRVATIALIALTTFFLNDGCCLSIVSIALITLFFNLYIVTSGSGQYTRSVGRRVSHFFIALAMSDSKTPLLPVAATAVVPSGRKRKGCSTAPVDPPTGKRPASNKRARTPAVRYEILYPSDSDDFTTRTTTKKSLAAPGIGGIVAPLAAAAAAPGNGDGGDGDDDDADTIYFGKRIKAFNFLSSMWPFGCSDALWSDELKELAKDFSIVDNRYGKNVAYPTAEAHFQSLKVYEIFKHAAHAEAIRLERDAVKAKRMGGRKVLEDLLLPKAQRYYKEAAEHAVDNRLGPAGGTDYLFPKIMKRVIAAKFHPVNQPVLCAELLATGDRRLSERAFRGRGNLWNSLGADVLGTQLMARREELRADAEVAASTPTKAKASTPERSDSPVW